MANKRDYISKLQTAVQQLHNCAVVWPDTVPVHEVLQEKTVWQGDVEEFELTGRPKSDRCCARGHLDGAKDERIGFDAVLRMPPWIQRLRLFN